MIKEIKYGGFATSPSDYECGDGQMASLIGLVPEDGSLKPVMPPKEVFTLAEGGNHVWVVHETSQFTHYVYSAYVAEDKTDVFYYYDTETGESVLLDTLTAEVTRSVTAIGNTLLIICGEEVRYYLWKDDAYKYLGNHLPQLFLSFGLQGHPRVFSRSNSDEGRIKLSFDSMAYDEEYPEEQQKKITSAVMAKVNKFVAQQGEQQGRFVQPFLVRYALRLYDGNLTMHSAPVLMNPGTRFNPTVLWYSHNASDGKVSSVTADIFLMACDLDYQVCTESESLDDWTDIVKSVDIFVSKPIYTYNQSGNIKYTQIDAFDSVFIGKLYQEGSASTSYSSEDDRYMGTISSSDGALTEYSEWMYYDIYDMFFDASRPAHGTDGEGRPLIQGFELPRFDDGTVLEHVANTSLFYLVKSIGTADLSGTRTKIDIPAGYLQSLVTREVMTDDYQSHDTILPGFAFSYNNRLNFAGIRRKMFSGFPLSCLLAYCHTRVRVQADGAYSALTARTMILSIAKCGVIPLQDTYSVEVYINVDGVDDVVRFDGSNGMELQHFLSNRELVLSGTEIWGRRDSWGTYFFFPDPNAYKMRVISCGRHLTTYANIAYEIKLSAHSQLNGAFAVFDYDQDRVSTDKASSTDNATFTVSVPTKVYTTAVNNPFFVPLSGINTVGTGTIIGLSTAAKALSQGQFGQFPLYCFTTEGVWAMEVSSTGSYSARQPITRDVCVNTDSITQLDSAVLFATDRGIMMLSGSNSECLSDILGGSRQFSFSSLPHADELAKLGGFTATDLDCAPFGTFLSGCRMIYSYVKQRIIVYNPGYSYAYVFSLKDKAWGMMPSTISEHVQSYPKALALLSDRRVVDYCETNPEVTEVSGLLVTRPLKLDAADMHKTVSAVIQRGLFRKGDVSSVLYGSRDLYNWSLVWSSKDHIMRGFRGTPYKYFRVAGLVKLSEDKSVFGASVDCEVRHTNILR